jgi:hypothetical protein
MPDITSVPLLPPATGVAALAIIASQAHKATGGGVWWRGHAANEWVLRPGVFRTPEIAAAEKNLALRFLAKAGTRYPNCPTLSDNAGWMFLMQHYGLPTRLLDWSESILVAAYFACIDHSDRDGEIWCLLPYLLNKERIGNAEIPLPYNSKIQPLFQAAMGKDEIKDDQAVAVFPLESDARMLAQRGTYTIHSSSVPLNELPNAQTFLLRVPVPASYKANLSRELWNLGIRRSHLFPDLQNLAAELKEAKFDINF